MEILAAFGLISLVGVLTGLWFTYIDIRKSKETIAREINQAEKQLLEDLQKMDFSEFYRTDPGLELLNLLKYDNNKSLPAIHKKQESHLAEVMNDEAYRLLGESETTLPVNEVMDDDLYQKLFGKLKTHLSGEEHTHTSPQLPKIEVIDDDLYQRLFGKFKMPLSDEEHVHVSNKLPKIEVMDDDLYQKLFGKLKVPLSDEEHIHFSNKLPKIEVMDDGLYQRLFGNQDRSILPSRKGVEEQVKDKVDLSSKIRTALRKIGLFHAYRRNDKTYTFDVPFKLLFAPKNEMEILLIDKSAVPRNFNLSNLKNLEANLSRILGFPVSVQSLNDSIAILLHVENYVSIEEKQKRK